MNPPRLSKNVWQAAIKVLNNIRFNYGGETTAAGITGTITTLTGGAGQADYADLWAAIGDSKYDFISIADDDATTIANVKTELDRRVNANVALEGVCILGSADSLSTVSTFGNAHNNFNRTYPLLLW